DAPKRESPWAEREVETKTNGEESSMSRAPRIAVLLALLGLAAQRGVRSAERRGAAAHDCADARRAAGRRDARDRAKPGGSGVAPSPRTAPQIRAAAPGPHRPSRRARRGRRGL